MPTRAFLHIVMVYLCIGMFYSNTNAQDNSLDLDRILHATVYITQAQSSGENLIVTCVGSGTIVSRDGLILTNAHNTTPSTTCPGNVLIIALTDDIAVPPVAKYRAEIVQADEGLDLALLRINSKLDGSLIDRETLALPFVELADSSVARLDETITTVGYPGTGSESVTAVRGTLTGFISEPRSLNIGPSWLKTNADISPTMSGGGAYNQNSQLVGIPTTSPISRELSATAMCILLQDTNRDDLINEVDRCVPVGGPTDVLRPSNFARPLLRGAVLGLNASVQAEPETTRSSLTDPAISRMFFAASVNEAGMPTTVISSLPAGSTSLYLFFDYQNMTSDTVYEMKVTTDSVPNPTFSLAPVKWSGGNSGIWYIGSSGQPWPNGVHEFTLLVNGTELAKKNLIIGEAPTNSSSFSDIVFGILDTRGNPQGNGFVLPTGIIVSARFLYRNIEDGMNWAAIWYLNGTEFQRVASTWTSGASGSETTSIEVPQGVPPGGYRLELYVEDRLAATSDFVVAGVPNGALPLIFTNLSSTTADSDASALTSPSISNLPNTIKNLYVLFDWQKIAPGTIWTLRWSVDNELFYDQTGLWNNASDGIQFITKVSGTDNIPDGTYTLDLLVNNLKLATISTQVGIGQLPIDRFAGANGIQLRGQIVDNETQRGIPSVTVVIISSEFSVAEFLWQQDQVFATATTDSQGNFIVDRLLDLSTESQQIAYSLIIAAEGYLPISADGIELTAETPNPLNVLLYLSQD